MNPWELQTVAEHAKECRTYCWDEEMESWLVVMHIPGLYCSILDKVNYDIATKMLEEAAEDAEDIVVDEVTYGSPYSPRVLAISPDAPEAVHDAAAEILRALDNYPVLDEDAWSKAEFEAACEEWESWGSEWMKDNLPLSESAMDLLLEHYPGDLFQDLVMSNPQGGYHEDSMGDMTFEKPHHITRNKLAEMLIDARDHRHKVTATP